MKGFESRNTFKRLSVPQDNLEITTVLKMLKIAGTRMDF